MIKWRHCGYLSGQKSLYVTSSPVFYVYVLTQGTWGHRLTHWGRETHICVGKLTIIASDNGLSPGRRQAIIWTNAGILLIGPLGRNVSEISIVIQTFSFKKMNLSMSFAKWRPFCLGLNVLMKLDVLYIKPSICTSLLVRVTKPTFSSALAFAPIIRII